MVTVNTHQAKTQLSSLLARTEKGDEEFLICRNGKPVAILKSPPSTNAPDPLKQHKELKGKILYDPLEQATEDEWTSMI